LANSIPQLFGDLDCLIAARSSSRSARPLETVTPLSKVLDQEVESEYGNTDYVALMGKLLGSGGGKYKGKSVLLCWHHEMIPRIAHALGANSAPRKWLNQVFDRIWMLNYMKDGKVQFCDIPQRLLNGDSRD